MAEIGEAMELDFKQAMQDFQIMFPDIETDIIEAVLQSNQGAVHETIDQLLSMAINSQDLENKSSNSGGSLGAACATDDLAYVDTGKTQGLSPAFSELPPSYTLSSTPPPSYQQAVPASYKAFVGAEATAVSLSAGVGRVWSAPLLLPLPKDFLRIATPIVSHASALCPERLSERLCQNAMASRSLSEADGEQRQYLRDERIALFLQNDEFVAQLRQDSEFMAALQREHDDDGGADDDVELSASRTSRLRGAVNALDDASFRERLATMGKVSRKKFAQLAKMFSRGGKRSGSVLGGAAGFGASGKTELGRTKDSALVVEERLISSSEEEEDEEFERRKEPHVAS